MSATKSELEELRSKHPQAKARLEAARADRIREERRVQELRAEEALRAELQADVEALELSLQQAKDQINRLSTGTQDILSQQEEQVTLRGQVQADLGETSQA